MLFIAGDWGTTQLRLYLCDGAVLDRANGPGIGASSAPPEQIFFPLTARWAARHGSLAAHLCGMVGSRNGWVETPYVPCPADAGALRARVVSVERSGQAISIVPGLSCSNPLGAPDVMRGEETQVLGAMAFVPESANGRRLFALPGTHTKWVVVEGGEIRSFLTSPTGELFALLRDHSTLARTGTASAPNDAPRVRSDAFMRGIRRQAQLGGAVLLHALFETRSRQLLDGLSKTEAMDFLSGLLIGADVSSALRWSGRADNVVVIGDPTLTELYAEALAFHAVKSVCLDGEECVLRGLRMLFELEEKGAGGGAQ